MVLSRIDLFPIKSLDGISVTAVRINPASGAPLFWATTPASVAWFPAGDPESGTQFLPSFQKTFMALRKKRLPTWANSERFNHFYRFAVNTSVPVSEAGKILRVGDPVEVE